MEMQIFVSMLTLSHQVQSEVSILRSGVVCVSAMLGIKKIEITPGSFQGYGMGK